MTANQTEQQPRMIILNEEHIQNLEAYINEMPTKLGLPLINFLNTVAQQQGNENNPMESTNDGDAASMQSSEEI